MATRYCEIVLEGSRGRARGFIDGFLAGRHALPGLLSDAEEEGFDVETLRQRIREAVHPRSETSHLLVEERRVDAVAEAVAEAAERGIPARVVSTRAIAGARFRFTMSAYSEEGASRVRGAFERLPDGVRLMPDTTFQERRDPAARGVEAYAPAHAYELRGEGGVEGDLEGVLALLRLCRREEIVRVTEAALDEEG
jgi:hypothetical protein